jgi:hypothetical protein
MKTIKKILLGLLVISALASFRWHHNFDQLSTPAESNLTVSGISGNIGIKWVEIGNNPHGALLLPVQIKGIKKTFYMQLDLGSPSTILYKKSLQSIPPELLDGVPFNKNANHIAMNLILKRMKISSKSFRVLDYGDKLDLENPKAVNIIGTIGTDLLEKRIIILDFRNRRCSFTDKVKENGFTPFEFKQRRILIPAKIENENVKVMYDSGASGYQLITSKEIWENYRIPTGKLLSEKVNSWGDTLSAISAPANKQIHFGATKLRLSEVTYIEGASALNISMMTRSGMQGMIGNKLFLKNRIVLDCKNQMFKIE